MDSYLYGFIGGALGCIMSHPFDTIRVRIQTKSNIYSKSILKCVKLTYKEGIRTFYKGIIPPLFGIGFEKCLVFGTYDLINKTMPMKTNKIKKDIISGGIAGLTATLIVTPIDAIKINMQANNMNFMACLKILLTTNQLYKGINSTFFREVPGFAIYFTTYNYLNEKISTVNKYKTFLLGGLSGCFSWLFIYPSDVIKARMQSLHLGYKNIYDCLQQTSKNYGFKFFYAGFSMAIMRAFPLHGGAFLGFEMSKNFVNNFDY